MKKFFVAVALVMGLGTTVAFAENLTSGVETVMAVNDFTPIEVKDLPAAVTEAIAKNFAESTVKEAAVEAAEDGSKTYQVVLTDKEGTENTVFFNEKGEILYRGCVPQGAIVKSIALSDTQTQSRRRL